MRNEKRESERRERETEGGKEKYGESDMDRERKKDLEREKKKRHKEALSVQPRMHGTRTECIITSAIVGFSVVGERTFLLICCMLIKNRRLTECWEATQGPFI